MRREASLILLTLLTFGLLTLSFGPLGVRGGLVELFYDDGEADQGDATVGNQTYGWGVKFDHPELGVDYRILNVKFYVFLEEAPLRIFIYLRHSSSMYRKVYEEVVDSVVEGWNSVDLTSSDIITDGDFVVGFNWVVDSTPFLGVDTDTVSHSGVFQTSSLTAFSQISSSFNYMIRASVVSTTIVVPDDYPTIQEAINAAYEGDTVFVRNGTYYENVVVNKSVALVGEGRHSTVIDGNFTGTVVSITADCVNITNFTLRNAYTGPVVSINTSRSVSISNNIITETEARNSLQGIRLSNSSNTVIANNQIYPYSEGELSAWGVRLDYSIGNTLVNNTISTNIAGILLVNSEYNILTANKLRSNWYGLRLADSRNNTVTINDIVNNVRGVYIVAYYNACINNGIYHNNFINNTYQATAYNHTNMWDNGCEGNYWSDYETRYPNASYDEFGIGNTPYVADGSNQDNFPLRNLYWNLADTNHDLIVDIFDIVTVTMAYWKPWDPSRFCHIDIAEPYGQIDIYDVVAICIHYGEEYTS